MNQKKFYDYYSIFGLSRAMSTSDIKKQMRTYMEENRKQRVGVNRNNTEILEKLNADQDIIRNAQMALCYDEERKKYDKELDNMPKASIVVSIDTNLTLLDSEEILHDTFVNDTQKVANINDKGEKQEKAVKNLEGAKQDNQKKELEVLILGIAKEAKKYFYKKEYNNCIATAKKLFEYNVAFPFLIIAKSYFMLGEYSEAVELLAKGCKAFSNSVDLRWLYIRYMIQMERYSEAQQALNEAKNVFVENSLFYAEQVYLYLYAERDDLAIDEIKKYISRKPADMQYRKYLSDNIIDISNMCYVYDQEAEMNIIADKDDYERCYNLLSISNQLYQSKTTLSKYEDIKAFSTKYHDKNTRILQIIYGLVALASLYAVLEGAYPMIIVTIIFALFVFIVRKYSFRPLWQFYRDKYRGIPEYEDSIVYMIAMIPRDLFSSFIFMFK